MRIIDTTKQQERESAGKARAPEKKKNEFLDLPPKLIEGLIQGHNTAFDDLCLHLSSTLHKFVYGVIHNEEEAKEIVQDTFVDIFLKRDTIDFTKNLKGLVYVTARNKALTYLRNIQSANRFLTDPYSELEDVKSPEEIVTEEEQLSMIRNSVKTMPDEQRAVMVQTYQEGLSTAEIAEKMNISERQVQRLRKKALDELMQLQKLIAFFLII